MSIKCGASGQEHKGGGGVDLVGRVIATVSMTRRTEKFSVSSRKLFKSGS